MRAPRPLLFAVCLLLAACQPGSQGAPAPSAGAAASGADAFSEGSERRWSGLLPCSDCQGVEMELALRVQGGKRRYDMVETYIGGKEPNRFASRGEWTESVSIEGTSVILTLDPGPAEQTFSVQDDGSLQLLNGGGKPLEPAVANRLQRL